MLIVHSKNRELKRLDSIAAGSCFRLQHTEIPFLVVKISTPIAISNRFYINLDSGENYTLPDDDVSDRIIASLSEAQTDRFFRAEKTYFNFRTEEVYFDDREVFRSPKDFEDQEVV